MPGLEDLAKSFVENNMKDAEAVANEQEAHGIKSELDFSETEETTDEAETTEEVAAETENENTETEESGEEKTDTEESESSLNTEEGESQEETSEETDTTPQPTFEEELATRTDGKYSTIEEMVEAISQKEETPAFEYGNELIARMDELAKQGVPVTREFIIEQMFNYEEIDHSDTNQALELVKRQLRLEDPEITDELLKYDLQDRYKLDPDEYSDEEIARSKAMLGRDARLAKKKLIENQKSNALPDGKVDPAIRQKQEAEQKAYAEKITNTLRSTLNDYKSEEITIGKEKFKFEFDAETKSLIEKDVMNTDKRYAQYFDKKGNLDSKQLAIDEAWANPKTRQKMLNAFLKQATSTGSKEVVGDLKNSSLSTKKKPNARPVINSKDAAIKAHLLKKFGQ